MGATTARPNILLVVIDCARSDKWLSPTSPCQTPVLDALRKQSITLPTTITEKSCTTPSFCGMLTGTFSTRHGVSLVWGYQLPTDIPMLTEALAAGGYRTHAEVTGPLLPEMGLARGFETYTYRSPRDYLHTQWGDQFVERLRSGQYGEPWFVMLHLWELHMPRQVTAEFDTPEFGRDAYDRAVSSLDAQLERVFAAAGDDAVIVVTGDHGEKTRSETFLPGTAVPYAKDLLGVDESRGLSAEDIAAWAGPSVLQQLYGQGQAHIEDVQLRNRAHRRPPTVWTRLRDRLRLLRLTPWLSIPDLFAIGRPLRETKMIERRGFTDSTRRRARVDRFMRSLGQDELLEMHLRMWTNTYRQHTEEGHIVHVYDYLARVPLVIRWPDKMAGNGAGRCVGSMVRLIDVLPTLLELLEIEWADEAASGRSFAPLLRGQAWEPAPAFVSVSGLPRDLVMHGVRTERYKYTYGPYNDEFPEELYDLHEDPDERHNRAATDTATCRELRGVVESMMPESGPAVGEAMPLDAEQKQVIEQRLQELGYIE